VTPGTPKMLRMRYYRTRVYRPQPVSPEQRKLMRTNIFRAIASIAVLISAFAVGSVAFGLKGVSAPDVSLQPVAESIAPTTVMVDRSEGPISIQEVKEELPDLSGIDWTMLALLIQEEQQIARQMSIDEARLAYGKCGEWRELALMIGWPAEEWPTLSYVLHRESRCNVGSHNKTDPMSGSRGLMQINGYWCRPSKYSKAGWLQERGILSTCDDLYDPEVNLRAGLAIWQYGEEKHGCGWRGPWATSCGKFG
jgi:hypothetical protein